MEAIYRIINNTDNLPKNSIGDPWKISLHRAATPWLGRKSLGANEMQSVSERDMSIPRSVEIEENCEQKSIDKLKIRIQHSRLASVYTCRLSSCIAMQLIAGASLVDQIPAW